jgi:glycosyltransferase involved in cell wall biosynthesis
VDALARAAAEVALDPERAAELRAAGLRRARRFSWRQAARATIAAYRRLGF